MAKKDDLKAKLDELEIEYPADATVAELEALLPEKSEEKGSDDGTDEPKWPAVAGNGKFQSVACGSGFVVYNGRGQRVSGILSDAEANDLVLRSNRG